MNKAKSSVESPEFLKRLVGRWTGTAKTWFEPGTPVVTAPIDGVIKPLLKAQSVGHTYQTRANGQAIHGLAIIGKDLASSRVCVSWVDTFHTGADVMLFHRDEVELKGGFSVSGRYSVALGEPSWGWRTTYQLKGEATLHIVHYNITPDGYESRAIEIAYKRAGAARPKTTVKDSVGAKRPSKKIKRGR